MVEHDTNCEHITAADHGLAKQAIDQHANSFNSPQNRKFAPNSIEERQEATIALKMLGNTSLSLVKISIKLIT